MLSDDTSIYAKPNPYGYRLNINHPDINPHYERYKRKCGTTILSDAQRLEFERLMFAWMERKRGNQENPY